MSDGALLIEERFQTPLRLVIRNELVELSNSAAYLDARARRVARCISVSDSMWKMTA